MQRHTKLRIAPFWIGIGQWTSLMIAIVTSFGWLYAQNQHMADRIAATNERLDEHIAAINARSDELYSTIIELLKERR